METIIDEEIGGNYKELVVAPNGKRFGNMIADLIVISILQFGIEFLMGGDSLYSNDPNQSLSSVYYILVGVPYYVIMEHTFGKTVGKFITRTKVVKEDGSSPNVVNLIGRNFARYIPFNGLSFLFADKGWHDSLSKTYVIIDEDSHIG